MPTELRSFSGAEARRLDCRAYHHRRRWPSRVEANYYKCYAPGKRISIQASRDYILFCIRCKSSAHELSRTTGIHGGKKPGTQHAENEEMHALREHGHLKETCKDRKVDDLFCSLPVVRSDGDGDK